MAGSKDGNDVVQRSTTWDFMVVVKMIFSAPYILLAFRWLPPSVAIFGTTATYMTILAAIRTVTWPFPERVYRRAEEKLCGSYQALIGFFFETWSGVEVGLLKQNVL